MNAPTKREQAMGYNQMPSEKEPEEKAKKKQKQPRREEPREEERKEGCLSLTIRSLVALFVLFWALVITFLFLAPPDCSPAPYIFKNTGL